MIPLPEERVPSRVVVEAVEPEIDGGRFPVKRGASAKSVVVSADIHTDGHDHAGRRCCATGKADGEWAEVADGRKGKRPLDRGRLSLQ